MAYGASGGRMTFASKRSRTTATKKKTMSVCSVCKKRLAKRNAPLR